MAADKATPAKSKPAEPQRASSGTTRSTGGKKKRTDFPEQAEQAPQIGQEDVEPSVLLPAEVADRIRSEQELERIFNLTPDMIGVAGTDGYFKRVNPAWEEVLGYTAAELLSKPFLEFIHPDDRQATLAVVKRLMAGEPTTHFENRYRCKDGSYKVLEWRATPAHHGMLYGVARDVTRQKQAEESLRASEGR
ncbi:unnamed protein product, partial [marine sediment metagenome]